MKVRVKLGSQSQTIVFEQQAPSGVRLEDLRQSVSRQFHLENHSDFQLSLNQNDALSGEDQTLDSFGIVSGDLLHVIGSNLPQENLTRNVNQTQNRRQPLATYSSQNSIESQQHRCIEIHLLWMYKHQHRH
uniref:Ubiquitin-like domain-containing protein n=1 Tax=Arion vulgaris TaxID=1028688 RepID=A0A0B7B378_9EUPU